MLKQALDFGKQIIALTRDTQQNKEDVKTLREELREVRRELAESRQGAQQTQQAMLYMSQEITQQRIEFVELAHYVDRLSSEMQHQRDNAQRDREIQELRLQNIVLRLKRGLPPGEEQE